MYNDSQSIYAAPALESTLLLEVGGLDDVNPVGELPSTNISASVSSGSRTFQYNRYFWNKEMFTFNYTNNGVGIAIAWWNPLTTSYSFSIYPIFLPRIAMTLVQSITSSPTDDPAARDLLMKELVYYLNMGFTSYGLGNTFGLQTYGEAFKIAPWVTAQNCKGSPSPVIVNNPNLPIFQDGASPPPLIWYYSGNNHQLCLRVNPNYNFDSRSGGGRIGFQIISLEPYMSVTPRVHTGFNTYAPSAGFYALLNNAPEASYGSNVGWCSQGAFATGFGQKQFYEGTDNSTGSASTYGDIYTADERLALWNATRFPGFGGNITTYNEFQELCTKFKLVSNIPGHGTGILLSHFITSLIPERFFSIESDALTRNQKRPVSSNNHTLPPGCMAVQFITLDTLRTWEDNTVAGQTSSAGSILFGSRKSGVDDCSIVALDPMQSLQTIDLRLVDEWGNVLKNYMELNSYTASEESKVLGPMELFTIIPESFPVPAWVLPFNPLPTSNNESILINESWWSSVYQFFAFDGSSARIHSLAPKAFAPSCPRSSTFSHFGRVLGY